MTIRKEKLIPIAITFFLLIISLLLSFSITQIFESDFLTASKFLTVYTIINLIILEVCLIKYEKRVNYYSLFIILCFLFLYGQCYSIALFNNLGKNSIFNITLISNSTSLLMRTALFVITCINAMTIGYLIIYNSETNEKLKEYNYNKTTYKNKKNVTKVGWLILIISIIPTLYVCFKDISLLRNQGYMATLMNPTGMDKLLNIFKGLFNSALLMLIISEDGKKKKLSYALLFSYLLLELIGGTRIQTFRFLTIILFLYFENNKITLKKASLGIVTVLLFSLLFSFISSSRGSGISYDNLKVFTSSLKENNALYNVFFECGHTQALMMVVFSKCPAQVDYAYGLSFLRAISSVIPNLGFWSVHPAMITVDTTFSPLYTNKAGLGSSIFAIAYWNFGFIGGIIFMLIFGMLIAKITKNIYERNEFAKKFMGYYLLFYISFLVRGDIEQFGRNYIFYCILPIIFIKILNSNSKKRRTI